MSAAEKALLAGAGDNTESCPTCGEDGGTSCGAPNCGLLTGPEPGNEHEQSPSMLLQLALQRVDFIVNTDLIEVSDETARRKGNPYAKRKINMGDVKHYAKWAANHLRAAWDVVEWLENGVEKWRLMYVAESRKAKAASATAQIAIGHLQALMKQTAPAGQSSVEQAARQWLASIGSEPQR